MAPAPTIIIDAEVVAVFEPSAPQCPEPRPYSICEDHTEEAITDDVFFAVCPAMEPSHFSERVCVVEENLQAPPLQAPIEPEPAPVAAGWGGRLFAWFERVGDIVVQELMQMTEPQVETPSDPVGQIRAPEAAPEEPVEGPAVAEENSEPVGSSALEDLRSAPLDHAGGAASPSPRIHAPAEAGVPAPDALGRVDPEPEVCYPEPNERSGERGGAAAPPQEDPDPDGDGAEDEPLDSLHERPPRYGRKPKFKSDAVDNSCLSLRGGTLDTGQPLHVLGPEQDLKVLGSQSSVTAGTFPSI